MIFVETYAGIIINAEDIIAILERNGRIIIKGLHYEVNYTERNIPYNYESIIRCLLTFIMGHIDEGTSSFIEYTTVMSAARGVEGK